MRNLQEWLESEEHQELLKSLDEEKQQAIQKYHNLPESDKLELVHAILHIICEEEKKGCSHRDLMNALGIYPGGFWITELSEVHSAMYSLHHKS